MVKQMSLFGHSHPDKKLRIAPELKNRSSTTSNTVTSGIPPLTLPPRWEYLEPKLEGIESTVKNIIKPIPEALTIIRNILLYLNSTGSCQLLVIRADSGSGKTTFLNTLPHYIHDMALHIQTIDIQRFNDGEDFGKHLWEQPVSNSGINIIILEGREEAEAVNDKYVQTTLSHINRYARSKRVPMLFVIPTIDEVVARYWCEHGTKIGDLIPTGKLYEGSTWYTFPGVPQDKYLEVAEDTIRALNPPYNLYDYGVSKEIIRPWISVSPTLGRFFFTLGSHITNMQSIAFEVRDRRHHVWTVFCAPDLRHYDHTYLTIRGLTTDDKLKVSPQNIVPSPDTSDGILWQKQWAKLVAAVNFLDVRLINFSITNLVTAVLAYGDEDILDSFKNARLKDYKDAIAPEIIYAEEVNKSIQWDSPLASRRLQKQNAQDSIKRSNLFNLLLSKSSDGQKGGNTESILSIAQYLHLRDYTEGRESELHYYIGCALQDLLKDEHFSGLVGVETESVLVANQSDPRADIAIYANDDVYALEFHFYRKQFAPSEISKYTLNNVISKYMKSLPHLRTQLDEMDNSSK